MSLVQEIIQEAKKETRTKLKRNSKRLIIVLGIIAIIMSSTFYYFDFPSQDAVYRQMPVFAGVPTLAMASFNAFAIISVPLFFLKSLSEVIRPTIDRKREQEKRTEFRKYGRSVYDAFNAYGQKDYSLQIDERTKGLEYRIDEIDKREKSDISEIKREFMPEFQKAREEYEKEKIARIKAENERDKVSSILNEVLTENFQLKEENKKLKGE